MCMERPKGAVDSVVKKIVSAKLLTLEKSVSTDYNCTQDSFHCWQWTHLAFR